MSRIDRAVAVRFPHRITQQGNYRQRVFEKFVENNSVRALIVKKAEDYPWSSACAHVRGKMDKVLADDCYMVEKNKRSVDISRKKT